MIIAADEVIPYVTEAFSQAGEVRLFAGRSLRAADIRDADALIVRSVTRVDAGLLEGTSVRFVGTASIGMDHLDLDYLRGRGVRFANASGGNANSVAEYVVATLLEIAERRGWILADKSIGIIGVGNIGSLVERKAEALGMRVLLCDPPLRESTGNPRYGSLDDVLEADILTLHVPLTTDGPYRTRHMIAREVLRKLSGRQFLINTSRGAIICETDLKRALRDGTIRGAALDVWENEPHIDRGLLQLTDIGTAHVAGSSLDGKVRGTDLVFREMCRCLNIDAQWGNRSMFPTRKRLQAGNGRREQDAMRALVLQAYDIRRDDMNLRGVIGMPDDAAAALFDRLRNQYALRPEFRHFLVEAAQGSSLATGLCALGFTVAAPGTTETCHADDRTMH
ncbi:MAG: phosphoglycerate dehydrogenase-like oxidoreductase [Acidobacteria bacterium]|nr:phosphoglycerate dehydrogenase-like oxidoreductase [Acidobacteriota bacterium]